MICVVIGRTRHKMVQVEIQEAAKQGAEMIELRLDYLARSPDFKRLLLNKPCPLVATVRRPKEGGRWPGNEDARRMLLRQAIVAGFDWVDLETDVADDIRRFRHVKRIVSYHNMAEVPEDLEKIHEQMCGQDPDVVKIAVMAQKPEDNLRVLALLNKPGGKPTVAFCMGDLGIPSRILGAKYGAPFTYGAFNKERELAPGMLSFKELKETYHYDAINADTQVYGVLGDPVAHSLSPLIHNAAMRQLGINAVYVPFRVPRTLLPVFLARFELLPVRGYSVTLPHKEAAAAAARHRGEAVDLVVAANTLVRREDGFAAFNTDYEAALESLRAHVARGPATGSTALVDRTILLLGAGGVARAVAHALQREGANVVITNRTTERAQKLADEVGCRVVDWGARHNVNCEILVNCTSVGMYPNMDESPIHVSFLRPGLVVFDTIYTPEATLLVKDARARGCHVLTGVDMFVRQAELQFQLFTGREAPEGLMQSLVKYALSPLHWRGEM
jgi:3-dehydroquinate dehydratase/shikimate dehydrogenase